MNRIFEDEFIAIHSKLISLCMDFTEGKVDSIYAYVYLNGSNRFFNAFFRQKKQIIDLEQIDTSEEAKKVFLESGTFEIEEMVKVCDVFNRECPIQLEMVYETHTGKYIFSQMYKEQLDTTKAPDILFNDWKKGVSSKLSRR